jgi:peroxiredoxin
MLCREQVAQLRHAFPDIRSLGARLLVVGNGTVHHLRWFLEDQRPDFPVFTDPSRKLYEEAGFRRDAGAYLSMDAVRSVLRAFRGGFRQARTRGDPWQQGGVLVFDASGRIAWKHVSRALGDHPDPAAVLEATRAAAAGPA